MKERKRKNLRNRVRSKPVNKQGAKKNMSANRVAELDITALTHDGRGIGRVEGKTVFVEGALPGERVRARIFHQKKRYDEAILTEILVASHHRVEPECEFFSRCGGCSLQHLERSEQLRVKEQHLKSNLERLAGLKVEKFLPAISGSQWHYRRKARFSTSYDKREQYLTIGFREKESANIIPLTHCEVLVEPFNRNISKITEVLNTLDKRQHISHVDVLKASEKNAIILRHVKPLSERDIQKLAVFSHHNDVTLFLKGNDPDAMQCLSDDILDLNIDLYNSRFNISFLPGDFIQINADINDKMLDQALKLLDLHQDDVVLDLFCGLGNFSLPVASQVQALVGVEGSKAMVERACVNAEKNQILNARFYCADLTQDISGAAWLKQHSFNKVILDPPRAGAYEQMSTLAKIKPEKIVYISCDPATLARDIAELISKYKYKLKQAGIIDMFPNTSHVESMVLLERK